MQYIIQEPTEGLATVDLQRFDNPAKTDQENYISAIVALAIMIQKNPATKAKIVQSSGGQKQQTLF